MSNQRKGIQKNKLYISGIPPGLSETEIQSFYGKYGPIIQLQRPRNQTYIFILYANDEVAAEALLKFRQDGIRASYKRGQSLTSSTSTFSPNDLSFSSLNSQTVNSQTINLPQPSNNNQRHVSFAIPVPSSVSSNVPSETETLSSDQQQSQNQCDENSAGDAQKLIFQNGDEVVITHVTDKLKFCAHLKSKDEDYVELITTMSRLAMDGDELDEWPCRGSLVFALHDGKYWRAVIQGDRQIKDDSVFVKLIDVGSVLKIPFSKLRKMSNEILAIQIRLTQSFHLKNINDGEQHAYAAKYFKTFIGSTLKMQADTQIVNPGSGVTLIDPQTKRNINFLVKQCTDVFTVRHLMKKPAPSGPNQSLFVVDDSKLENGFNLITFILHKDLLEFKKQLNQIQAVGEIFEKFPSYEPNPDDVCLVKYNGGIDGQWHRGVLESMSMFDETKAIIYLLDHQYAIETELKFVRKINDDLVKMPVLSFTAAVEGYDDQISKNDSAYLQNKLLEKESNISTITCDVQDGPNGDPVCLIRI